MKLNFKNVGVPALILFVICVIVTALLGTTNELTKDIIAETNAANAAKTRMIVLPDAKDFEEADGYFIGKNGGEDVGYVFTTESGGYGGKVKVMTGIGSDGMIKGVAIISHSETPGLGANCTKDSFKDMYKQPAKQLTVVKNKAAAEGEIEAMTGATITTNAVTNAVNEAVSQYEKVKGGN